MNALRVMFQRLDGDGSGEIDEKELLGASEDDRRLLNEFMSVADPLEIFHALDIDGTGALDISEFCEGLYQAAVSNTPIELKRMDKRIDAIRKQQDSMSHA